MGCINLINSRINYHITSIARTMELQRFDGRNWTQWDDAVGVIELKLGCLYGKLTR
jgi:hypothetical protein